jgi:hypothetical protein
MNEITSFNYFSAVRFCRRPSLSFERGATNWIVVGEHKLVVELLACRHCERQWSLGNFCVLKVEGRG